MFKKTIHFIQYNNLTVFIILGFFLVGSSVLAQTETGQEIIGTKTTTYEGVDNTLLLEADLDNLQMDYNIENIEQDEKYYYVTYTFINLEKMDQAWQYQMREKKRKVSRKLRMDLGKYLAEELKEEYQARIKELKKEQKIAEAEGETQITAVTEYSGLVGKTLELASSVFADYEPIKKTKLPSPSVPILLTMARDSVDDSYVNQSIDDDLEDVYADYVAENDPDGDGVFGVMDNCPNILNPDQMDIDEDGMGNACDPHPESYDAPSENKEETGGIATSSEEVVGDTNASSSEEIIDDTNASSSEEIVGDVTASSSDDIIAGDNATSSEEIVDENSSGSEGESDSNGGEVSASGEGGEPNVEIIELPNDNSGTLEENSSDNTITSDTGSGEATSSESSSDTKTADQN